VRTAVVINGLNGEFRHTVISLNGDLSGRGRLHQPEAVTCLPAPPRRRGLPRPLGLARLLARVQPDLAITYTWGGTDGLLAARWCGLTRVIHAEDGFGPDEADGQKLRRILARRLLLRTACQVVCPSRTLVGIARRVWSLPPQKILYVPNGVDTHRFAPAPPEQTARARQALGLAPTALVVGTVGQLRGEKNHERLLRAFARLGSPLYQLLIVGDGPLQAGLTSLAGQLGIRDRVVFTGPMPDPVPAYQAMDLFALSSDTEQMPIAVLEAMAAGLPVVSTDVGDVRCMLAEDNRAYVVPPREELLAPRLADLLENPQTRRRLGQANRGKCVEEYAVEGMVRAYQRLYRSVLEAR
jgi:glycosyltransferase involved in cell wall biosynthesis